MRAEPCDLAPVPKFMYHSGRSTAWEAAIRILLVEDNPYLSQRWTEGLQGAGFVVDHAADGETGYGLGRSENFDAIILDLGLPDTKGVDVLKRWRQGGRVTPV